MDTRSISRSVDRGDHRVGARNYDDDLPGQSLLREYEASPLQGRARTEVYAETQRRPCSPCMSPREASYAVAPEYRADDRFASRNYEQTGLDYRNQPYAATAAQAYREQQYDAAYLQNRNYVPAQPAYDRACYPDSYGADRNYQNCTPPIVIIDRPPQDYEREHRRGPGIGHAILGLAALAGSVAFSYYGRNGGFNWGHGGWGAYRGGCGNGWGGGYGNGWGGGYGNGWGGGYGNGWGGGYGNGWGGGYGNGWGGGYGNGWNNGWNNGYRHHNNSWVYPVAGMAMSLINRNGHHNGGWNNGWNRGGWNQHYQGGWNNHRRCR